MNQLETNLTLWAICSILLFEILIIICLCRCCFNRIKPKKFYVKREEHEYYPDINNGTQSKYQSTILRPPHSDELALVGTLRRQSSSVKYDNGIQNWAFYRDDEDQKTVLKQTQNFIELQPTIITTANLPANDYEIHSYPTDDYVHRHPSPIPRPSIIDFRPFMTDDDQLEKFRFQPLRRPEIIPLHVRRIDTSTESYGYSNIVPKSILKSTTNSSQTLDLLSTTPYLQTQHSTISSNFDESPQTSNNIYTDQSIPIKSISTSLSSKDHMRFASFNQLNEIEWEIPREFRTLNSNKPLFPSDRQQFTSSMIESKLQQIEPRYLSKDDITQQQAFEY